MDGVVVVDPLDRQRTVLFVTQIYFCSMYAIVVWDWLVGLGRERRLIWKVECSRAKCAYIFCRYWVLLTMPFVLWAYTTNHDRDTCERIYKAGPGIALWNQASAQLILLIRTHAFYGRDRRVGVCLSICLIGTIAYQVYSAFCQMMLLPFLPPDTRGPCFPVAKGQTKAIFGFFLASLGFDLIVTIMTIYRFIILQLGKPKNVFIRAFLFEGLGYFVVISLANIVNAIFYTLPDQYLSALNVPLSITLPSIMACRLVLDLRDRSLPSDNIDGLPLHISCRSCSRALGHMHMNPNQLTNIHEDDRPASERVQLDTVPVEIVGIVPQFRHSDTSTARDSNLTKSWIDTIDKGSDVDSVRNVYAPPTAAAEVKASSQGHTTPETGM